MENWKHKQHNSFWCARMDSEKADLASVHYLVWNYRISRTIRRTMIFSLDILEKKNDECILILVIYWKKTGLVHTKISNRNIIYSS